MRISLAVAALAMAGVGAMKTYGAYTAANMSDSDLLLMENVEALSTVEQSCSSYQTYGCGMFRGTQLACTSYQTWQCCKKGCD